MIPNQTSPKYNVMIILCIHGRLSAVKLSSVHLARRGLLGRRTRQRDAENGHGRCGLCDTRGAPGCIIHSIMFKQTVVNLA